jgi:HlyD family secretion protein
VTLKLIAWIGLVLLAATMAGTLALSRYGLPWQGSAAQTTQAAESSAPLRRAVAALGRIEPHSEVIDLGASTAGLVDELLVEEGQFVARGETLGYLDSYKRVAERDEQAARCRPVPPPQPERDHAGRGADAQAHLSAGHADHPPGRRGRRILPHG